MPDAVTVRIEGDATGLREMLVERFASGELVLKADRLGSETGLG